MNVHDRLIAGIFQPLQRHCKAVSRNRLHNVFCQLAAVGFQIRPLFARLAYAVIVQAVTVKRVLSDMRTSIEQLSSGRQLHSQKILLCCKVALSAEDTAVYAHRRTSLHCLQSSVLQLVPQSCDIRVRLSPAVYDVRQLVLRQPHF